MQNKAYYVENMMQYIESEKNLENHDKSIYSIKSSALEVVVILSG